jgi:hypothetical protein
LDVIESLLPVGGIDLQTDWIRISKAGHLHQFVDGSKEHMADFRHRALRHHSEGIFMLEKLFGTTITLSTGRVLPVRFVGEQHVVEDLGRIPTVQDWLGKIQPESWMLGRRMRRGG